jgi:predicted methyltransferase
MLTTQMQGLLTKFIKSLKPGGYFIVIFPTARDATGTDDTGRLHRIDKEVVRGYVQAAGFVLTEESRILWNNADNRTTMVETETQTDLSDRAFYIFRK